MPQLRGALACLYNCADAEVLVEGRAGTSKTTGVLTKLLCRAKRYPRSRHLIVRETRASLTESVLVTLERLVGENHPEVLRVKRDQRHSYRLWGSEVVIGGLDKPPSLYSTEWDTVYAAEAIEIAEDAWELFGRAMRHGKTPYHQRIADCNPGAPSHWLNRRATACQDHLRNIASREDYDRLQVFNHHQAAGPMRRLVSVHQDNPGFWDIANWQWTPEGRAAMAGLLSMTGHRRARMLDGRWVAAEGSVFPEFSDTLHVVNPFPVPADWPHVLGYDPGFDHPTCALWIAIAPDETYYVVDEIYEGGKSVAQHGAEIMRRNQAAAEAGRPRTVRRYYADPQHAFSRTAQAPTPIASQFRQATGINMTPWPRSTDKEAMVNRVRERLGRRDRADRPAPLLKVFRSCVNTVSEFQSWRFKRTGKGELPAGDDAYEDKDNHAMDVVCGIVSANPKHNVGNGVTIHDRG